MKACQSTAWILFLAAYAQFMLGLISGVHQASMVRDGLATGVIICSPLGSRQVRLIIPGADAPQAQTGVNCPVCTLASMPVTTAEAGQPMVFRQELLVETVAVDRRASIPTVKRALIPPTRAPPNVS